jgi:hypothetical protein
MERGTFVIFCWYLTCRGASGTIPPSSDEA